MFQKRFADCKSEAMAHDMFRELSKVYHPDKGGDETEFAALSRAYQDRLKWLKRPPINKPDFKGLLKGKVEPEKKSVSGRSSEQSLCQRTSLILLFDLVIALYAGKAGYTRSEVKELCPHAAEKFPDGAGPKEVIRLLVEERDKIA